MFGRPALLLLGCVLVSPVQSAPLPKFSVQEIERQLGVGYAVLLVDVNHDGKKDIVVVDQTRVVWYENPTWKRRTITEGQTKPDNVCLAAHDIDGDGQIDFALGAGWKGLTSKADGPLYWLQRGKSLDEPWKLHPLGDEPSVHRIRFADVDGDDRAELIVSPLLGRNSTPGGNWVDGVPVKTFALKIPKDPVKERWPEIVLDQSLQVVHNFYPVARSDRKGVDLLMASDAGVTRLMRQGERWEAIQVGAGNQANPKGNRGASEIKQGSLGKEHPFLATIEPWHGNQVVVYTLPLKKSKLWERQVLDERLKWGHAVWCADLDGDGPEELIIGVRDDLSMNPGERRGVRLYRASNDRGTRWERTLLDEGGVAVEDLAVADLDNDGDLDLVAVGRQTHNIRLYWNERR